MRGRALRAARCATSTASQTMRHPRMPDSSRPRAAPTPAGCILAACLGWLTWPAALAAPVPQPPHAAPAAPPPAATLAPPAATLASPPARCASGPSRADYVSLRAATESALAAAVAHCRSLGYRRVGGAARAVVSNPGASSPELYFQVMVVPPGAAASATASAASSPARPPGG